MLVELVIVIFFAEIYEQAASCASYLQAGCAEVPALQGLCPYSGSPGSYLYVCACLPVRLGPGEQLCLLLEE